MAPPRKHVDDASAAQPVAGASDREAAPGISLTERYGAALDITEKASAANFFEWLVTTAMAEGGLTRQQAEERERHNLGYFSGYGTYEQRLRVERLFGVVHPCFGSAEKGPLTPEEAFAIGQRMGMAERNRPLQ